MIQYLIHFSVCNYFVMLTTDLQNKYIEGQKFIEQKYIQIYNLKSQYFPREKYGGPSCLTDKNRDTLFWQKGEQ